MLQAMWSPTLPCTRPALPPLNTHSLLPLLQQELERLEKQASNAAVMRDPAAMKQLMAQIEDARRALETERARSEALRQQGELLRKDAEVSRGAAGVAVAAEAGPHAGVLALQ